MFINIPVYLSEKHVDSILNTTNYENKNFYFYNPVLYLLLT